MTAMSDSLTVVDPIDLVPRRRFSRLSAADDRALRHEIREAETNLTRLRAETMQRHPEWFA